MALTAREEKFCNEYVKRLDAFDAGSCSGLTFTYVPERYYVYFLINPLNNHVFYVGKGKGNRKDYHVKYYTHSSSPNSAKNIIIHSIIKSGLKPISLIFINNLSETEAYNKERIIIERFSQSAISNISPGYITQIERSKIDAKLLLARLLPLDKWKAIKNPDRRKIRMYFKIKKELKQIAEFGHPTKIICTQTSTVNTVCYE